MGRFFDMSIKNVIEGINQNFFLPDIQREYVWLQQYKEKKIEQLFDSILRGYPIGSFLFWKLKKNVIETDKNAKENSEKLNFQLYKFIENYDVRSPHNEKINVEQVNYDDLTIVLDGQQRLTSLYIGLKGTRTLKKPGAWWDNPYAFEPKKLYLNLRHQPDEENPEDNYQFEFHKARPEKDEMNYWIIVGRILDLDSIVTYARKNNLSDAEMEILEKLKNAFCSESRISYYEETEKNLDKVLKIFIRVNSGGTALSYSDLLMSILTANFSSDIRDLMYQFIDSIKDEGFSCMDRDHVLKTCLLLTESNHTFQLKNFTKNNIKRIETNWEKITEAIFSAIKALQEFGYRDQLSSGYILSVVAYFIYLKGNTTPKDKKAMWNFVRNAQITAYFTTALDYKLDIAVKTLRESESFEEFNNKLMLNKTYPLKITSDDIEGMFNLQYGHSAILPILQTLYPNLDYTNNIFHIDHIYPKSKFNQKNKSLPEDYQWQANYLFNLQLLEGKVNEGKSNKDPEKWLDEFYDHDKDKISAYKERNYIDSDFKLDWERIDDFRKKRSEKMQETLKTVFGVNKEKADSEG